MDAEKKKLKSSKVNALMRKLHRDAGGLVVALTLMFTISGSIMVFRDIALLESEAEVRKTIETGLDAKGVKEALRIKRFQVRGQKDGVIEFEGGSYDPATGEAVYTQKGYPAPVKQLTTLHKATSGRWFFPVTLFYGLALFTLMVTSFWMYKPGTAQFKRYATMVGIGLAGAVGVLLFV